MLLQNSRANEDEILLESLNKAVNIQPKFKTRNLAARLKIYWQKLVCTLKNPN